MTSITRLTYILNSLENKKETQILNAWKTIFEVSTLFEVYEHLQSIGKEVNILEKELIQNKLIDNDDYKNIISSFHGIINYMHMTQKVNQIILMSPENVMKLNMSLNSLKTIVDTGHFSFKFEDEVDEDKFNNFKNSINETIEEIENSDMPDEDKKIFLSIFYDFNKAISLYKINGLDSFMEVIENNICKIKMIDELANKGNKSYNKYKDIILKSLNEVWFWIKIYQKVDQTLKLGTKIYGYLKDKVTELVENQEDEIDISE